MYTQITETEKDILREILNVGVSKAADAFSQLTRSPEAIVLTVPDIKIIDPEGFLPGFQSYDKTILAMKTRLQGDLAGITLLLFTKEHTDWIISHCLSERELQHENQEELRMGLLLEMSNILTGAVITQLTNILHLETIGLPPESIITNPDEAINNLLCHVPPCQPIVLSVRTDLTDQQKGIELPMLIALESSSLQLILDLIRQENALELLKR
jgi:chemotaxis protein CheC